MSNEETVATPAAPAVAGASDPAGPLPVVEIPLRRPPFWTQGFSVLFLMLASVAAGVYVSGLLPAAGVGRVLGLLGLAALCGAAVALRLATRPRAVPPIRFHDDHMTVPRSVESARDVSLQYEEVLSVDLRGRGGAERLFIGTRKCLLSFPRPAFGSPDALEGALKELYLRILRLPQGAKIVEQIARRRKVALAAMSTAATATHGLLTAFALMYGLEYLGGAFETPFGLVRFGASAPVLVRDGDAYRLLASALLHGSLVHLYFNVLALLFLGSMLERLLGRARFLLIFLISALGAAVASTLWPSGLFTVNASSGTFGLLGAFAVLSARHGPDLPVGFRQPARWWALIVLLNTSLVWLVAEIELTALVCGFVVGGLVALLVVDADAGLDPTLPAPLPLHGMSLSLAAVFAVSSLTSLGYALRNDGDVEHRFARLVIDGRASTPEALNVLAWSLAISPKAETDELEDALAAAERAVELAPDALDIRDTLAAVHYRRGRLDEAIALQRDILARAPRLDYADHLAIFLRAQLAHGGPAVLGGARASAVKVTITPPAADGRGRATVELAEPLRRGLSAYVLGLSESGPLALLALRIGAGASGSLSLDAVPERAWPKAETYELALVDGACDGCPAAGELSLFSLQELRHDLP